MEEDDDSRNKNTFYESSDTRCRVQERRKLEVLEMCLRNMCDIRRRDRVRN